MSVLSDVHICLPLTTSVGSEFGWPSASILFYSPLWVPFRTVQSDERMSAPRRWQLWCMKSKVLLPKLLNVLIVLFTLNYGGSTYCVLGMVVSLETFLERTCVHLDGRDPSAWTHGYERWYMEATVLNHEAGTAKEDGVWGQEQWGLLGQKWTWSHKYLGCLLVIQRWSLSLWLGALSWINTKRQEEISISNVGMEQ